MNSLLRSQDLFFLAGEEDGSFIFLSLCFLRFLCILDINSLLSMIVYFQTPLLLFNHLTLSAFFSILFSVWVFSLPSWLFLYFCRHFSVLWSPTFQLLPLIPGQMGMDSESLAEGGHCLCFLLAVSVFGASHLGFWSIWSQLLCQVIGSPISLHVSI